MSKYDNDDDNVIVEWYFFAYSLHILDFQV